MLCLSNPYLYYRGHLRFATSFNMYDVWLYRKSVVLLNKALYIEKKNEKSSLYLKKKWISSREQYSSLYWNHISQVTPSSLAIIYNPNYNYNYLWPMHTKDTICFSICLLWFTWDYAVEINHIGVNWRSATSSVSRSNLSIFSQSRFQNIHFHSFFAKSFYNFILPKFHRLLKPIPSHV